MQHYVTARIKTFLPDGKANFEEKEFEYKGSMPTIRAIKEYKESLEQQDGYPRLVISQSMPYTKI